MRSDSPARQYRRRPCSTMSAANTIPPNDFSFYEMLNEVVQQEPVARPRAHGFASRHWHRQRKAICAVRRSDGLARAFVARPDEGRRVSLRANSLLR